MKKRVLSFLMTLCMVLTLMPMAVFAEAGHDHDIAVQEGHTHCYCGGSVTAGDHTSHSNVTYQPWNGTDAISYDANKTAYVYLTNNATLSSDMVVDGRTLYLCLNGKTLSSNGTVKFKVRNSARLVLCDCQGSGSIKGVSSGWGGGCVYLYNSTLDMYGGKLTGAKVKHGGGVALDDNNCKLNLYGGSISGNTATVRGGGVYMLNGGTVNIYGGSISNNTASGTGTKGLGGGIFLEAGSGSINIYGGSVSNNTAKGVYGGGIYLNSAGTVTMSGGEISGNKLANVGDGGGICLNKDGAKLIMSGGTIKNNSASVGGGVLFTNPGTFTMTGGLITGNTATGDGGGVRLFRNITFNISGGEISGNKAGSGGGVQMEDNSSTINISGAPVIKNNTVSGKTNNLQLTSGKTLNISGAMTSGANIGITTEDTNYPVVISNAYDTDYSEYFFSDDNGYHVEYTAEKKLALVAGKAHVHSGGTADCMNKAVCAECGKSYGELDPKNHASGCIAEWTQSETTHKRSYSLCGAVSVPEEAHEWEGGVCSECAYVCRHKGGAADCFTRATCEICGEQYGDLAPHTYVNQLNEYRKVSDATCISPAVYYQSCSTCGAQGPDTFEYGEPDPTNHASGCIAEWTQTETTHKCSHSLCGAVSVPEEAHEWQDGVCTECAYVCRHRGGTADCLSKATCEICGEQYGDLNPNNHTGKEVWVKDKDTHEKKWDCCGAVSVEKAPHSFDKRTVLKEPSCLEGGIETYICTDCGEVKTMPMGALGHDFKDGSCTRCDEKDPKYNPFIDVFESDEYYDAVLWAYYHKPSQITTGYTENEFRPGLPCTRAQVVTFLWRAAGCPEPVSADIDFTDAAEIAEPFRAAVAWAAENGITTGYGDGSFRPNEVVTRAQFVTFLWRFEGKPEAEGSLDAFADADMIAEPYKTAVAWAAEKGITVGYEDGTFRPNNACARWAVVMFLYRDMK